MLKIAIIIGTTRPNRKSETVARWAYEIANLRKDAEYELVDLRDYDLPFFDEPYPPSLRKGIPEYARAWSEKIASFDGFLFVTGEYNHGIPGVLKNAIDYLFYEWNDKAAGFVSYGSAGGARAVEQLRLVMGEVHVADIRPQVMFNTRLDFENMIVFKPNEKHTQLLNTLLDKLVAWSTALQGLRENQDVLAKQ
ncbi:MAG: NADPH-dependent FMN reductase [Anaerolineales bacterium]|nr:MAG: NADPH-dependent FMN reductase [Anaerolineales bacterium]